MNTKILEKNAIKGYKAFNVNGQTGELQCRDMVFKENAVNTTKDSIKLCNGGIHFCPDIYDVFEYYGNLCNVQICEVEAWGETDKGTISNKIASRNLRILRRLSVEEVFEKIGFVVKRQDCIERVILSYDGYNWKISGLRSSYGNGLAISENLSKSIKKLKLSVGIYFAEVKFFKTNVTNLLENYNIRNISYNSGIRRPSIQTILYKMEKI